MYVLTTHFTLLAFDDSDDTLTQVKTIPGASGPKLVEITADQVHELTTAVPRPGEQGVPITTGPLQGYLFVNNGSRSFHLFKDNYVCAPRGLKPLTCDRPHAKAWETFHFVEADEAAQHLEAPSQGEAALEARVRQLLDDGQPVCLHFGCGHNRLEGFLDIDKFVHFGGIDDYFLFDFTATPWPMPDASVDYVYSEDFIEHIPQRSQVAFLAEAFRVLKPGAYHRVNTPCLADSMRTHSDFSRGMQGVYFDEFDEHHHVCLFTRGLMTDLALAIGYRQVFFTAKSQGSSPYAVADRRPEDDRDDSTGNIYADLLK